MADQRLKYRTLSSAIIDRLREDIVAGIHPAGAQLRQDALAEAYGVSRIPVREALFQLEAEGFVRIVPQKGAVVSPISQEEVNDVFDLRAMLEPRLLAHSLPLLTEADFAGLERIQSQFVAAVEARDVARWGVLNAEFHAALYARAELPRSQTIVGSLLQTSDRYTRLQLSRTSAMGRAEREHARLIELCRAGAREQALDLLVSHIEAVRSDLLRVALVQ